MNNRRLAGLQAVARRLNDAIVATLPDETDQPADLLHEQRDSLAAALTKSAEPWTSRIAVVGSFKVGKSSFVNALLDKPQLAADESNPATAAVTVFRYGDGIRCRVQMLSCDAWRELRELYAANKSDDRAARYKHVREWADTGRLNEPLEDLERRYVADPPVEVGFSCEDWAKDGKQFREQVKPFANRKDPRHYLVDRVAVEVPCELLADGVELLDTPGLNGMALAQSAMAT